MFLTCKEATSSHGLATLCISCGMRMRIDREQLTNALKHLARGDWQAAHEIVQQDEESALACWAHGIVHLMEGDLANARYWYGLSKRPFNTDVAAEIAALGESLKR
jgi:hypothetical protein